MVRELSLSIGRSFLRSWIPIAVATVTMIVCSALSCGSAKASSCGSRANQASAVALPKVRVFEPMTPVRAAVQSDSQNHDHGIVGLWHILLLLPTTGEVFDEGFDQFHSDGTEILNDNPSPGPPNGSGDVCLGVFKKTESGTYRLKHPFWNFDENGVLTGSGVLLETIILDDAASFHGSFTLIDYDLEGVEIERTEGDLKAERITPD